VNITVCLKQVPSSETKIRINTQTGFVDTSEVEWVLNPYDEYAMETALRLKEKAGAGTVTVVSLGPDRVKTALRTALAMGGDSALAVTDPALAGTDALTTGRVLAAAVKRQPFDLVLCGKQAIDDDQAAVPPALAHFLGIPHVSVVAEIEGDPATGSLVCHREIEGATELVHARVPCLVTVQKGKFEPRYPTLKGMMASKKKDIPSLSVADLGVDPALLTKRVEYLEDRLPPGRKAGRVLEGEPAQAVPELVRLLRDEAKVL
jgi:electron transfer flavoprotein beta subunit